MAPFGMRRLTAVLRRVPGPLDYTQAGTVPADGPPGPVDVIVPVYGAAAELGRCLESLARHTDGHRHGIVLVIDGPQPTEVEGAIAKAPSLFVEGGPRVLRNPARGGFVRSVNRGMADSKRDVVLLNSDTEVTERWLEKLQAAAYSSSAAATATPFSNNATLASLPRPFEANAIPTGHDVDSFARLVESVSQREYPRLPTGVGLCLYIKRKVLDALGPFDEAAFGLGYGEENDFCFRALRAGYVHVLDDATFVFHAGQRSFGASRSARVKEAERRLAEIHPEYLATIARFMREDPLHPARERILAALTSPRNPRPPGRPARVVHVVQGWPPFNHAGTEVYARGLAVRQSRWRDVGVHARLEDRSRELGEATELFDGGIRVRLVVNNFTQRDPRSRNSIRNPALRRDLGRFLDEERPDLVHVHHLAGHSLDLLGSITARRIPLVLQMQDWWLVCARANLSMADRSLCPGPSNGRCARCMPLTGLPPAGLLSRLLHARRRSLAEGWVRQADALVMGSEFIAQSLRRLGFLGPSAPVRVIPYGITLSAPTSAGPRPRRPVRFGYLGAIMPHKGVHVAVEAFRNLDPARATLDVVGDVEALPSYANELRAMATSAVRFSGSVPETEKARLLSGWDVLVVPSLGLESFGLAAREAMALGVPVLASRRGALIEAFEDGVCGAYFEPGVAAELRAWVDRLCERPQTVAEWGARLPKVKTMDAHAEEIEGVYEGVLGRAEPSLNRLRHAAATAFRVARAEGLAATRDRLLDRVADVRRYRRYRALSEEAAARFATPILNVLSTPPSPRFGGVPTQLLARLRFEEKERPVALLYPTGQGYRLEVTRGEDRGRFDLGGAPLDPVGLAGPGFESAVRAAVRLVGASCIHVEGVAGLPLRTLCDLQSPDLRLVVSVHDFALFCPRPHLMERPEERFCGYCRDLERCGRCLAEDWPLPGGFQARRRAVAAELLAAADAVVYPSAFLRDRHAELFGGLEPSRQHVIGPAVDLPTLEAPQPPRPIRHVAYVGAVHAHKGALVFEDVVKALTSTTSLRFTVFGGGDARILARLRRLPRVRIRGYYRAGSLPGLLRRENVDLALLLSIWPEAYGITLDECRAAGVPVVAFDHGAMGERLPPEQGSVLVPIAQGAAGVARVLTVASPRTTSGPPTVLRRPGTTAVALAQLYDFVSRSRRRPSR